MLRLSAGKRALPLRKLRINVPNPYHLWRDPAVAEVLPTRAGLAGAAAQPQLPVGQLLQGALMAKPKHERNVLEDLEDDVEYWHDRKDEMLAKAQRRQALLDFCKRHNILSDPLAAEALKELL